MNNDDKQSFNEAISNNPGLTSLKADSNRFNYNSFKLISINSNLTKLSISFDICPMNLDNSVLSKLPNIKTLEFYVKYEDKLDSISLLIQNCPNLEELILSYFFKKDDFVIDYINSLTNLKVLNINSNGYMLSFLDKVLPQSNLEKLEINTFRPIRLNFSNFANMKKLEIINNIWRASIFEDENKVPEYEGLNDWKIISYNGSAQYWKVKQ
jgi:hypothetical protein